MGGLLVVLGFLPSLYLGFVEARYLESYIHVRRDEVTP